MGSVGWENQTAPSPCDQPCLCLMGLQQGAESPDGRLQSCIRNSDKQTLMLLINGSRLADGAPTLGLYQCVPAADRD